MYESFCLELEKVANPNILKYLHSYRPDAALSAVHREFGLLQGYLNKEGLEPAVKSAIMSRIADLNRTEYLVRAYKDSYKKFGRSRKPKEHMEKGFLEKLKEVTGPIEARVNQTVMSGKMSRQDAQIAMKAKVRESVPEGLNKDYVENLEKHLGLSYNDNLPKFLKERILQSSVRPDHIEANPRIVRPFAKHAQKNLIPVTGSKGRNKSGLAVPKPQMSVQNASAPIVTKKLNKTLISTAKKSLGNLQNAGMSDPEKLGKIASEKLPGVRLLSSASKRRVKKPTENYIRSIPFSFKKPELVPPPKTKLTKYLQRKGLK